MTRCPLPVDWDDLLTGRPSDEARAHLDDCPACQAVVVSIEEAAKERPDVQALIQLGVTHSTPAVLVQDDDRATPAVGDIRWLSVPDFRQSLPVLVLMDLSDEIEGGMDTAPLTTAIENATPGDLLLGPQDTTTNIPWCVSFRSQTVIDRRYLGGLIGHTTASGKTAVQAALAGALPPDRTGAQLESEYDPRLDESDRMLEILYRAVPSEGDEGADEEDYDAHISESAGAEGSAPIVLLLKLQDRRESSAGSKFQLAAAGAEAKGSSKYAYIEDGPPSASLEAKIWYDWQTDSLMMRPEVLSGLPKRVRLIVRSVHAGPIEIDITLQLGEDIVLASGLGLSEHDIEALEMHVG